MLKLPIKNASMVIGIAPDDIAEYKRLHADVWPEVLAQIDLAWVDRGGHDPAEYLRSMGDRVFAVHAKDNAPEGENEDQLGFAAVGAGTMEWPGILEAAVSRQPPILMLLRLGPRTTRTG